MAPKNINVAVADAVYDFVTVPNGDFVLNIDVESVPAEEPNITVAVDPVPIELDGPDVLVIVSVNPSAQRIGIEINLIIEIGGTERRPWKGGKADCPLSALA